jgi:hypothetical protein
VATDETDDDEAAKKTPRATIIRRVLVGVLALACAGGWIYTRYLVKKGTLGEACTYDMHCRPEAPRCLKGSVDEDGVCSRSCETDGDCAEGIRCIKVELEDRDDRGRPLEGGYCFPQAVLDARRRKNKKDAGAGVAGASSAKIDSWLDVPEAAGQLEGEVTFDPSGGGGGRQVVEIKGRLVRSAGKHGRTIVDTSTLRVYTVDDEKKTFSASQLAASPNEIRIVKTDRTDKVADHDCEIWQTEERAADPRNPGSGSGPVKATREACVVKGAAFVDSSGRTASALEKELAMRGVLPLRITEGDKTKALVVKLDLHPLDAGGFAIPKSFRNLAAH